MSKSLPRILLVLLAIAAAPFASAQPKIDRFGDALPDGAIARLGTVRFRHTHSIHDFAFSSDGKSLASIDALGGISIWEVPSGRLLQQRLPFAPPQDPIQHVLLLIRTARQVAFARDNLSVIVMESDKPSRWRPGEKQAAPPKTHSSHDIPVSRLSPYGTFAAIATSENGGGFPGGAGFGGGGFPGGAGFQGGGGRGFGGGNFGGGNAPAKISSKLELFDQNGSQIAAWNLAEPRAEGFRYRLTDVAFSVDEKKLAFFTGKKTIVVYGIETKKEQRLSDLRGTCHCMEFTPNGKSLISVGDFFHEWDLASGKLIRCVELNSAANKDDRPTITDIAFSPDGERLAILAGSLATLLDAKTLKRYWSVGNTDGPLHFSPDGKLVAIIRGNRIRLLDADLGKPINPEQDAADVGSLVRFERDGKTIVTEPTGQFGGVRRLKTEADPLPLQFRRWNARSGFLLNVVRVPLADDLPIAYSDNHEWALTQGKKHPARIQIWNVATQRRTHPIPNGKPFFLDGTKKIALADTGMRVCSLTDEAPQVWLLEGNPTAYLLDVNDMQFRYASDSHFSPDGTMLKIEFNSIVSSTSGGRTRWPTWIRFYDAKTGTPILQKMTRDWNDTFNRQWHWSYFSPDSQLLASNANESNYSVLLWDLHPQQLLHKIAYGRKIACMAFAPDSCSVAIAEPSGRISLWECATGGLRHEWQSQQQDISKIMYSPDGRLLLSQDADTTVLVWDLCAARESPPSLPSRLVNFWNYLDNVDARLVNVNATAALQQPKATVAFLREKLMLAKLVVDMQVQSWIADLGSNRFAAREAAMLALRKHLESCEDIAKFESAHHALKAARGTANSLEKTRRLDQLLQTADELYVTSNRWRNAYRSPDRLRAARAIELLERIGNAEALALLRDLANGHPLAAQTRHAREAVARLERRRD